MTDDDYMFLVIAILGLAVMVVWQFVALRRLRKEVRGMGSSIAGPATQSEQLEQSLGQDRQVEDLRNRVQVLERITVEKEHSLSKQIEELRDR